MRNILFPCDSASDLHPSVWGFDMKMFRIHDNVPVHGRPFGTSGYLRDPPTKPKPFYDFMIYRIF